MKWILVLFGIPLLKALTIQDTTIREMSIEDLKTLIQEYVKEELGMTTRKDPLKQCMKKHNEFRRKHGSPDIKLDQQLIDSAQDWADQLAYSGAFDHSDNEDVGENLFAGGRRTSDHAKIMEEAVADWYKEVYTTNYNYNNNDYQDEFGHFTQVVWASSTSLGCGVAWDDNSQWNIVVCQYYPPGNMPGKFKKNVKPPSSRPYFWERPF